MAFCIEFEEPCHMEIKRRLVKENVLAVTDSLLELGGVAGFSTHVGWTDGQLWVEVRTELSNCFRLMNNVWLGLFLFSGTWQMSCNMFFFLSYHNHLFHFCKCICNNASENIKLMYRWFFPSCLRPASSRWDVSAKFPSFSEYFLSLG